MEILLIIKKEESAICHESKDLLIFPSGLMIVVLTFYNVLHSSHYSTLSLHNNQRIKTF